MRSLTQVERRASPALVDRRSNLSLREFRREYLIPGRPVILTDLIGDWPARHNWTFERFKRDFGDDTIPIYHYDQLREFTPDDVESVRFSEFIDAISTKDWTSYPYYFRDDWRIFERHPELKEDYRELAYFFDWFKAIPKSLRMPYPRLFISPKGAVTPLHIDVWRTHAWLSQLVGRKRWLLFSPEQERFLYDCRVRVDAPDLDQFPEYEKAVPLEATIEPGDTVFVPSGWAHWVISLDAAISLSANYMSWGCFSSCLTALGRDVRTRIGRRISFAQS